MSADAPPEVMIVAFPPNNGPPAYPAPASPAPAEPAAPEEQSVPAQAGPEPEQPTEAQAAEAPTPDQPAPEEPKAENPPVEVVTATTEDGQPIIAVVEPTEETKPNPVVEVIEEPEAIPPAAPEPAAPEPVAPAPVATEPVVIIEAPKDEPAPASRRTSRQSMRRASTISSRTLAKTPSIHTIPAAAFDDPNLGAAIPEFPTPAETPPLKPAEPAPEVQPAAAEPAPPATPPSRTQRAKAKARNAMLSMPALKMMLGRELAPIVKPLLQAAAAAVK